MRAAGALRSPGRRPIRDRGDEAITYLGDACALFLFEPLGPVDVG